MSVEMTYEHNGATYNAEIAKISDTTLGYEGHGILTAYLYCDFGGAAQGVGGYGFDGPVYSAPEGDPEREFLGRRGSEYGMEWVVRCLKACGVDSWEKVKGRTILVLRDGNRWNARVVGIAPLPSEKGKAFIFSDLSDATDNETGRITDPTAVA